MPLLLAPLIGRYGHKIDMRMLVTFSFIVYALCYYWRSVTFSSAIDFTWVIIPQFMQGFAVACFFFTADHHFTFRVTAGGNSLPLTSLSSFFRSLSGSIGTTITMTLWSRRDSFHHAQLTESVTEYNPRPLICSINYNIWVLISSK